MLRKLPNPRCRKRTASPHLHGTDSRSVTIHTMKTTFAAVVCLAACLASCGLASAGQQPASVHPAIASPSQGIFLVFPFENDGASPRLDWLCEGLEELTIQRLSAAGQQVYTHAGRMRPCCESPRTWMRISWCSENSILTIGADGRDTGFTRESNEAFGADSRKRSIGSLDGIAHPIGLEITRRE